MKKKAANGKAARRPGAASKDLTARRAANVKGGAEPINSGKLRFPSPRPAEPINN